jgi:hypothetical protein
VFEMIHATIVSHGAAQSWASHPRGRRVQTKVMTTFGPVPLNEVACSRSKCARGSKPDFHE